MGETKGLFSESCTHLGNIPREITGNITLLRTAVAGS